MRIGLTGTMSVGKTTLVNALKELEQFKVNEWLSSVKAKNVMKVYDSLKDTEYLAVETKRRKVT